MKNTYVLMLILLSLSLTGFSQIDKILGKWKTIDEKDGSEQSIIYIYKATNGKYYGKIENFLNTLINYALNAKVQIKTNPF
jgi:hypothetical protein